MSRRNVALFMLSLAIIFLSIVSISQTKRINNLEYRVSVSEFKLQELELEKEKMSNSLANLTTIETIRSLPRDVPEEKTYSEEVQRIALVTMAEAEGESEEGKRLVIDTILNRQDSDHFPDTASGVIYQKNQFSSMWNGRVDRCEVQEDICELVEEELLNRTNSEVIFFNADRYSKYGTPLFHVGNHYFSNYV